MEDRDATIRVPRLVADEGKGFLEDRRPAANFDPYLVTDHLIRIIVLGETTVPNPYVKEDNSDVNAITSAMKLASTR